MNSERPILIAGPTASGKSARAMALGQARNGMIVNADSMQVYRELRILTARPGHVDEARVPHRLYGHISGGEAYSVGTWLDDVRGVLSEAQRLGRRVIIVGGTGLYFKALLGGLSPVPEIAPEIRARWREVARSVPPGELHRLLKERDPEMATQLAAGDRQRHVRALEVIEATGRSLADWQKEPGAPLLAEADVDKIVVCPPREVVAARIEARFEQMIAKGALAEVGALRGCGFAPTQPIMRALGVRPLLAHLEGRLDRADAVARVEAETRQYAKRQVTWLRRNMGGWDWDGCTG